MGTPTPSPFALEINRVADEFEAEWKAGRRQDPQAFLLRLPEAARRALLVELVRVEVEYRRKAGEAASEAQYLRGYLESYAGVSGVAGDSARSPTPAAMPVVVDHYALSSEL